MPLPQVTIAKRAALAAGRVLISHYGRIHAGDVQEKTANDFVTKADLVAEEVIAETILKAYPDHAILCEEHGRLGAKDSPYLWIIDPLDGTTNYIHGVAYFAVSIALQKDGAIVAGIVYNPISNELFEASLGEGALLNERRIRVSARASLSRALLGTGIPYHDLGDLDDYLASLRALIDGTAGVRRCGAAALDLAHVAAGRLDGFWEFGLRLWDIAAGTLLVREAGGLVTDDAGGQTHLETGRIVAATPQVLKKMLERLSGDAAKTA